MVWFEGISSQLSGWANNRQACLGSLSLSITGAIWLSSCFLFPWRQSQFTCNQSATLCRCLLTRQRHWSRAKRVWTRFFARPISERAQSGHTHSFCLLKLWARVREIDASSQRGLDGTTCWERGLVKYTHPLVCSTNQRIPLTTSFFARKRADGKEEGKCVSRGETQITDPELGYSTRLTIHWRQFFVLRFLGIVRLLSLKLVTTEKERGLGPCRRRIV